MKNKIAIIANGSINDKEFHKKFLKDFDIVICADGGANNARELDITPDYIIGDLDSADSEVIDYFNNKKTEIINDDDQNKTDLELAIALATTLDPSEIKIFGAIGNRIDHTLANIFCLTQIKPEIKAQIIDEKNVISLVEDSIDVIGKKDDLVSVVPLTDVFGLSYNGLKWNVSNKNTRMGWFGISNRLTNSKGKINLSKGKILVIKSKE